MDEAEFETFKKLTIKIMLYRFCSIKQNFRAIISTVEKRILRQSRSLLTFARVVLISIERTSA